jgi:casein kinase II subunit beta
MEDTDEDEFSGDSGWIPWFCGQKGYEFLAEVEEEYIRDNFNLYGLRGRVNSYDQSLEMILSGEAPDEDDLADDEYSTLHQDATVLYGLIHARYITSPRGLSLMREKFLKGDFGTCPRVLCDRQHVLPMGLDEDALKSSISIFCPKCEQTYNPKNKHKDLCSSFFGTSFPQIFLQNYTQLVPVDPPRPFTARVFGFRLHKQRSMIQAKIDDEAQPKRTRGSEDRNMDPEKVEGRPPDQID